MIQNFVALTATPAGGRGAESGLDFDPGSAENSPVDHTAATALREISPPRTEVPGASIRTNIMLFTRHRQHEEPHMSDHQDHPASGDDIGLRIVRFGDLHEPVIEVSRSNPGIRAAFHHPEIAGGANGLERVRMLDAIDGMRAMSLAIEALEVVRAVCERPQYTIERRAYERGMGEPAHQWCLRSQHQARDFVATFADPGDGSVRFVLVTVEAEEHRKAA